MEKIIITLFFVRRMSAIFITESELIILTSDYKFHLKLNAIAVLYHHPPP